MKDYIIQDIYDSDFGCEERPDDAQRLCVLQLSDAAGNIFRVKLPETEADTLCPGESLAWTDYDQLPVMLSSLIADTDYAVSILANTAAMLWQELPGINWVGFYLCRGDFLVLGPFQGRPACIRIDRGHGVCGTALERDEVMVVPDVHRFPGHIACDTASRSEIVLPLHGTDGDIIGVLDIDSPRQDRFSHQDRDLLCRIADIISGVLQHAES